MAIITISRQVGSLGDEIAEQVASKLNYKLVSRADIHKKAESCDAQFKDACLAFEAETSKRGWLEHLFLGDPGYTALFESLNYEFAAQGDVVLVGRGAHLVLQDIKGILKCRITAPINKRIEWIAQKKNMTIEQADRFVANYGKRRTALLESVFPYSPRDLSAFDLMLNTAQFNSDQASDIIAESARKLGADLDKVERSRVLNLMAFGKLVERAIKDEIITMTYRDIEVKAEDGGVIILEGMVADELNKEKAAEIAKAHEGVTKVIDNLTVVQFRF